MATPRVSVCVPTFNGAAHLRETLDSIRAQTFEDFELLVVDDGSTDATLDVLSAFSDPRLVLHRNPRRLGLPGNWNRGLALARGEYVKLVFQDDTLVPTALERLVAALDHDPEAVVAFARREIRHEGEDRSGLPLTDDFYRQVLDAFYRSFHARLRGLDLVAGALGEGRDLTVNVVGEPSFSLVRRAAAQAVGGFDPRFEQLSDWEFTLRVSCGAALAFVDETLGVFRVHAGAQSAQNQGRLRVRWEFTRLVDRVAALYRTQLPADLRPALVRQQWKFRRHFAREAVRAAVGV